MIYSDEILLINGKNINVKFRDKRKNGKKNSTSITIKVIDIDIIEVSLPPSLKPTKVLKLLKNDLQTITKLIDNYTEYKAKKLLEEKIIDIKNQGFVRIFDEKYLITINLGFEENKVTITENLIDIHIKNFDVLSGNNVMFNMEINNNSLKEYSNSKSEIGITLKDEFNFEGNVDVLFDMIAKTVIYRLSIFFATNYITAIVDKNAKLMNLTYNKITIKNLKSRFGSCSGKRNINFTYHLLYMPKEISEYIILHELCHLIELNHSPLFWKLLDKYSNNGDVYKLWVKNNASNYIY